MSYIIYANNKGPHDFRSLRKNLADRKITSGQVVDADLIATASGTSFGGRREEIGFYQELKSQFCVTLPPAYISARPDLFWYTFRDKPYEQFLEDLEVENKTLPGPYWDYLQSPALTGTAVPTPPITSQDKGSEYPGFYANHPLFSAESPKTAPVQYFENLLSECGYVFTNASAGPWGGFHHPYEPRIVRDWGNQSSVGGSVWYNQAVMNLTDPAWQDAFVAFIIAAALDYGYQGVIHQWAKASDYSQSAKKSPNKPTKHGTWYQLLQGATTFPRLENQLHAPTPSFVWDPRTCQILGGADFLAGLHVNKNDKYNLFDDREIIAAQYFLGQSQISAKLRAACTANGLKLLTDLASHGSAVTQRYFPTIPQLATLLGISVTEANQMFWGGLLGIVQHSDAAIVERDRPLSGASHAPYHPPSTWQTDLDNSGVPVYGYDRGQCVDSFTGVIPY